MDNQSTNVSVLVRSLVLSSPNFRIHTCSAYESVPTGPELPESLRATNSMYSFVMLMGIKISVSSFIFNVEQDGIVLPGCFLSKTNVTFFLIMIVLFSANSSGCKTPPFFCHSQIGRLGVVLLSGRGSKTFDDIPLQFESHKLFLGIP